MYKIILFDGECNLCDKSVQFIIKRDPNSNFKFASLQSEIGNKLVRDYKIPKNIDSITLIDNGKYYQKSTAALNVCKNLTGVWMLGYLFFILPKPIRDYFYEIIAKNRYKWFGKKEYCLLPSPEIRNRFL